VQFIADKLLKTAIPASTNGEWEALLRLDFARTERGTRLMRKQQLGPLYVQRPFYPEGAELAHVYLLHPPGGLVSGDTLELNINLRDLAQVLCTTPGAARVYRARSDQRPQKQINKLTVAAGCTLEWLPQENIIYSGAHAQLRTQVELEIGASFIGWEITALGLPASNAALTQGSLLQRLELRQAQRLLLREQLQLNDHTRALATATIGLRGAPVTGLMVCGPFSKEQLQQLPIEALRAISAEPERPALCGFTQLGSLVLVRYLGSCTQQARRLFMAFWTLLRPLLLARPASAPAIWST
jgi:urease accessory protein